MRLLAREIWTTWLLGFGLVICLVRAEESATESSPSGGPAASIVDVRGLIKEALDVMRAYPAPKELTLPPIQPNPSVQSQSAVYPRRAFGTTTYNGGVVSDVDRRFGPMADSQPNVAQQVSRLFATPTSQDMERLFHLPADIVHRLAADAGYIKPGEEDPHTYSATSSSDGGGGLSSFDFNLSGHGNNARDLQGFIASLQNNYTAETPSTPPPVIAVPGPPKITTRQVMRDGKLVAVPLLIIPQANGPALEVPFADMRDFSNTVNRIISTGRFQVTTTTETPDVEPTETMKTIPADAQVEPTTRKSPSILKGPNSPFVQQFDHQTAATDSPTTKKPKPTKQMITEMTTEPPTPEPIPKEVIEKAAEIVLDGRRYKLVAVETAEQMESLTTSTAKSSKSTTTQLPISVVRTIEARGVDVEETTETDESAEEEANPEVRAPTLRELEERYNRENALAAQGENEPEEETTVDSSDRASRLHRTRLLALRTPISIRKPKPGETIKTRNSSGRCGIIRAFAHKFGVEDLRAFALEHCEFLERYDPALRCGDVATFVSNCEREFS